MLLQLLQQFIDMAAASPLTGLLAAALIAGAIYLLLPAAPASRAAKPSPRKSPEPQPAPKSDERMDPSTQWQRLSTVVGTSIDRSHRIADLHTSASRQLDSTDYALHCLVKEMQNVMAIELPTPLARDSAGEVAEPKPENQAPIAA